MLILRERWTLLLPFFQIFFHRHKADYIPPEDDKDPWKRIKGVVALGLVDEAERIISSLPEDSFFQPDDQFILAVCFTSLSNIIVHIFSFSFVVEYV